MYPPSSKFMVRIQAHSYQICKAVWRPKKADRVSGAAACMVHRSLRVASEALLLPQSRYLSGDHSATWRGGVKNGQTDL